MDRFSGKRVLVTGGASGIGQATVLRLLREGASVVGVDIAEPGLAETRERAGEHAGRLTTFVLDVADEQSVRQGTDRALATLGGLDVLVNAAGILRAAHTHECSLELWNQVIGVNLTGTFLTTRAALPALLAAGGGVVVNFSSTAASFAHPYMAAYSATKGGIEAFTHTIALEYSKQGLRAVALAPGGVLTGMTKAGLESLPGDVDWPLFTKLQPAIGDGVGRPEAVAGVVAMVASEDGQWITGTEIRIDGGTHQ